ncbi:MULTISPECIES: methyl-accepting chemotaxis protein [Comamonas]|uniref:Chemotaxis protein n=1 Tax=Comamonas terrigena TaxID=32013 RepID=A0A2A7UXP0_COMTR|nr:MULTISPECIES: methyl-accepting chemotaxis protein [Comamonas]MBD9530991.1 chemotaxis protein [Comamonas sp. CMM01]PEH90095.1 chemotaxis protein [Comamonas terrigena]BBL25388.1 methyl-accepting chemotaxis protein [Comamonas terrigena NBRC 13299]SUY71036.1 Dipeptide chemoreceptor protein [Comamonas terrigena]
MYGVEIREQARGGSAGIQARSQAEVPLDAQAVGRQADLLLLLLTLVSAAVAVVIGAVMSTAVLPAVAGGAVAALALASYALARGSQWTRFVLPLLLSATVALHIQVSLGMIEFHFGVFVTLALVMVYRDWRVVLACAAFFAVHHVLFDRLQAWGLGMYCLTEASFPRVLLHAAYVVLQTGVEIFIVYRMNQAFSQGRELNALVQQVDQPQAMVLDVAAAPVVTAVAQRLQQMFMRVHDTVDSVKQTAAALQSASARIAAGSQELSARTEQARHSVEETATAAHEIRQTVGSTAQIAQHAHGLVGQAAQDARQGGSMVDQLVQNMQTVQRGSDEIASIVGVVDSLAFQTNLLALNAAVEAARAGEQGRGFAVVAEEVRRLALRSGEAAKDIRRQIDRSVQAVAQGAALSGQVQSVMQGFESRIGEVAERMQDIAQAAVQQHEGIAQISDAIGQLEQATAQNAELAEQSLATAQMLQAHTQQMEQRAALFVTRTG